jgi:hypothetical protein
VTLLLRGELVRTGENARYAYGSGDGFVGIWDLTKPGPLVEHFAVASRVPGEMSRA